MSLSPSVLAAATDTVNDALALGEEHKIDPKAFVWLRAAGADRETCDAAVVEARAMAKVKHVDVSVCLDAIAAAYLDEQDGDGS